jgi:hypothetical protein
MDWPDIGTATAADLADKLRFDVGQPDVDRPAVGADLDMVAATVIAAIDQRITEAGCAHFAQVILTGRSSCGARSRSRRLPSD